MKKYTDGANTIYIGGTDEIKALYKSIARNGKKEIYECSFRPNEKMSAIAVCGNNVVKLHHDTVLSMLVNDELKEVKGA